MSDFLIKLGKNTATRKIIGNLGVSLPQELQRAEGPWTTLPLGAKNILVGGAGHLDQCLAESLAPSGANVYLTNPSPETLSLFQGPQKKWDDSLFVLEEEDSCDKVDGLVFDATAIDHPDALTNMYKFFHPRIRSLGKCGRIVVIGRPVNEHKAPAAAAAAHALEGFVRSVAKEIGKKGGTAQVVYVETGAEDRINPILQFILSKRSAFISGQVFNVNKSVTAPTEIPFEKPLAGKVALVTGAARGIGATTAAKLAEEGAKVICLDRPEDEETLNESIGAFKGIPLLYDLSHADAAEHIAKFIKKTTGSVDIVIHNAGITRDKTLGKMKQEVWDLTININLSAVIRLTNELIEKAILNENGRMVCLSSIAGIAGNFGQTNYAASKSGIIGYVQAIAPTLAQKGITVNAVAPGFIETRMTAAIPFITREAGRRLSNVSQGGLPQDISETITFLASPGCSGITGNIIRVCGGSLIGA